MRPTGTFVEALAHHFIAAHYDTADERIGTHGAPPALGKENGPAHDGMNNADRGVGEEAHTFLPILIQTVTVGSGM